MVDVNAIDYMRNIILIILIRIIHSPILLEVFDVQMDWGRMINYDLISTSIIFENLQNIVPGYKWAIEII